jgi:hypothetical protein
MKRRLLLTLLVLISGWSIREMPNHCQTVICK